MAFEEFHKMTIGGILSLQAERYPNLPFLKLGDNSLSYREVEKQANRLAAGLSEMGLQPGDRLAVILPNVPEFVVSIFAAGKAGYLLVPVNVRRSQDEILARLIKPRPKALITFSDPDHYKGRDHLGIGLAMLEELPNLEHLIVVYDGEHEKATRWKELLTSPTHPPKADIQFRDPAAIIHTLGSSGEPRGALLCHRALARNATTIVNQMRVTSDDIFLGSMPFSNTFGLTATVLACAVAGAQLVCLPKYSPAEVLSLIPKENISIHHGVPTMFAMELNHVDFDSKSCATLRTGIMAGAPCPPELVTRVREEMGVNVILAYGLTETAPAITMTRLDDGPITATETVGRPLDGIEIKVINEEGESLSRYEIGELCVRGYNVMDGYWGDPEATDRVLDENGWLHTGDLAAISPDGPVRLVGRKGQEIIRGGFKIYPGTVEMKLRAYPGILDAAVVGVPDLIFGELIYACVVRQSEANFTTEDLIKYAGKHLPDYAIPDRVLYFEELPRTGTGPVWKDYLRERVRIRGHSWKFGKNVDTDAIIPARRCNTSDPRELAQFCMEDADPEFVKKVKRGDLIVADANFGCGSSREVAPLTIKASGVSAVIAKSFARIFFRNAINIGLPILECPDAVDGILEGDEVEVEPTSGLIHNLTRNETYQAEPFPDFLQRIIDMGGLLSYVEDRLAAAKQGDKI